MRTKLYSPEYDHITTLANKVIYKYVKSYPLNINVVMDSIKSISFKTYSCSDNNFREMSLKMSDTGYSYQTSDKKEVVYNDTAPEISQIFCIVHELGHLGLDHFSKRELFFEDICTEYNLSAYDPSQLTGIPLERYNAFCECQERAANYFADVLLAPNWAIDFVRPASPNELREVFNIGNTCAEMRYDSYKRWLRLNKPILSQLEVINSMTIPILIN